MARSLDEVEPSQAAEEQRLSLIQLVYRRLERILGHYRAQVTPLHQLAVTPRVYNPRCINNIVAVIERNFDHIQCRAGIT
ncbi:hypothetical protein D3C80_1946960 [compost metagenome]